MCIALVKGIELCYRLLTQCEEGCREARKYLSNSGGSVVDYANSELLRRGGHNIKDSPFGNYIYAQTLRRPYNRELLLPYDQHAIVATVAWEDQTTYSSVTDEQIGDMIELAAMYLWTRNDYEALAAYTYYFATATFLGREMLVNMDFRGQWTNLDALDTSEPPTTAWYVQTPEDVQAKKAAVAQAKVDAFQKLCVALAWRPPYSNSDLDILHCYEYLLHGTTSLCSTSSTSYGTSTGTPSEYGDKHHRALRATGWKRSWPPMLATQSGSTRTGCQTILDRHNFRGIRSPSTTTL